MSVSEKEKDRALTEVSEEKFKIFSELLFFISSGKCDCEYFVFG